jgi:putative flippase GtrA
VSQFLRFSLVGLINTAVGLLCIWGAMYLLSFDEVSANLTGYALGLVLSFVLNRLWTFSDQGAISRTFPRWLALAAVAYLVNLALVVAAHRVGGLNPYLAQPIGIAAYTAIMFIGSRALIFREPRSSRAA